VHTAEVGVEDSVHAVRKLDFTGWFVDVSTYGSIQNIVTVKVTHDQLIARPQHMYLENRLTHLFKEKLIEV
jgi:hypothetical protein